MLAGKVQWGIIGCGNVTEKKSGPAFQKVDNSSLVAVMRRDAAKAKDYATRHGVLKWYADADSLINDPDVNAIYVATPPGQHEAYAMAAIQAGKPVYVEKPMSTDLASCIRMKEAAEKANVKLVIAHYRRRLPMFLKIKELVQSGYVGEVRTVRISMLQQHRSSITVQNENNWRIDPVQAGAGLFYDLAPHQLDLVVYFFGEPVSSYGMSANQAGFYEAEDIVAGLMQLPGKVLFTGQWCYTTDECAEQDLFEIIGSGGVIRFPVFGFDVTIEKGKTKEVLHFDPPAHIQQPMINDIVRYFRGETENPCSADDAIASMKAMETFAYGNKVK